MLNLKNTAKVTSPNVTSSNGTFAVIAGPDRKGMSFPLLFNQQPQRPTEFTVDLPCGPKRLALNLSKDYSYSKMNAQIIQLTGTVVGISDNGPHNVLPNRTSWETVLEQHPVRMCYDTCKHTGTLFLQPAAIA